MRTPAKSSFDLGVDVLGFVDYGGIVAALGNTMAGVGSAFSPGVQQAKVQQEQVNQQLATLQIQAEEARTRLLHRAVAGVVLVGAGIAAWKIFGPRRPVVVAAPVAEAK